jgi:transcriptional regulator with GAF, ATPase, and Fis domain
MGREGVVMDRQRTTERDASSYRRLLHVWEAATSRLDLAGMLEALAAALHEVAPVDALWVATVDADGMLGAFSVHLVGEPHRSGETAQQVIDRAMQRGSGVEEDHPRRLPIAGTATEHVCRTRQVCLCRDLNGEPRFAEFDVYRSVGVQSFVCAPLFVRDQFLGSINYVRIGSPAFDDEEARRLGEISAPVSMALANSLAHEEILHLRDRLAQENIILREEVDTRGMFDEIVGRSQALRHVLTRVQQVAATDTTVLILGETGTGKELIARAIHRRSKRSGGPLICINCAALPSTLISSELFGHERGAFTGAVQRRIGRFELAGNGSIFLDEVGDLPIDTQVMLLRVLQEKEFERVGGTHGVRTNARVIAATHHDLGQAVEQGTFRSDLFFRLNVFPIEMPPLRERPEDIPLLVEYFALRHGARVGRSFRSLDARSLRRLMAYPWPGNVRELENVVERAVILSPDDRLQFDEHSYRNATGTGAGASASAATGLRPGVRQIEKRLIEDALAACRGRVAGEAGAARRLGVPPSTLERKIRLHRIDKFRFRRS